MEALSIVLLALFWPLLPLSLPVSALLERVRNPLARSLLMLIWPQIGVVLVGSLPTASTSNAIAPWLGAWAVLGALFYAWRLLSVRDLAIWARLHVTSAWSLLWLAWLAQLPPIQIAVLAVFLSLPAVVLTQVSAALQRRSGGAYLGLGGRLGSRWPRLAAVLAVALTAALAAPPMPPFFALLHLVLVSTWPLALCAAVVWVLWTWAVARLWQISLFGAGGDVPQPDDDLNRATIWLLFAFAAVLAAAALAWSWQWLML